MQLSLPFNQTDLLIIEFYPQITSSFPQTLLSKLALIFTPKGIETNKLEHSEPYILGHIVIAIV